MAEDACKRGAAAGALETGTARRRFACVCSGESSRWPNHVWIGATRSGEACSLNHGFSREARASTADGVGRGQNGHSSEPVKALLCTRKRQKGMAVLLTTQSQQEQAHK
jgi:hypothetical protein